MTTDRQPPGPAADAQGRTVVDPTDNVKSLNDASVRHINDLMTRDKESTHRQIKSMRREARLRSSYEEKLALKESDRLDAIRQRDNEQVASAAAVQLNQQNTLAATVDRSAEAMRVAMAAQALTVATTLDAKMAPLTTAISDLQRFQFESGGAKAQVVESRDSATDMKPVLDAIANLTAAQSVAAGAQAAAQNSVTDSRARSGNVGLWVGLGVALFFGSTTAFLGLVGLGLTLYLATR